jgi:hypothetical protein
MRKSTLTWLKKQEKAFLGLPRLPITDSDDFLTAVPSSGGVYVLWSIKSDSPAWVGETCHLHDRIHELVKLPRHVFRKKLAATFELDPTDAVAISLALSGGYKISYRTIDRGRKELEEFLVVRWNQKFPKSLLNRLQKRFMMTDEYKQIKDA